VDAAVGFHRVKKKALGTRGVEPVSRHKASISGHGRVAKCIPYPISEKDA
jgi:hypothetical protein